MCGLWLVMSLFLCGSYATLRISEDSELQGIVAHAVSKVGPHYNFSSSCFISDCLSPSWAIARSDMDFITSFVLSLTALANIQSLVGLVSLIPLYWILQAIYNVSPLHPLAKFPGPRLAAATYLYEAYYDWWNLGTYGKKIKHMHTRYGEWTNLFPDFRIIPVTDNIFRTYREDQPGRASLQRSTLHGRDICLWRSGPR